jgi:tight adherence protein C
LEVDNMTVLWIVLGALLVGAVILVIIGLRYQDEEDPLQKRLAEFAESGRPVSLEEVELSQPFAERIIFPAARKMGELVTKFTPQNTLQTTAIKLERAGNPAGLDPNVFFTFRLVGLALGPLMYWLASIAPEGSPLYGRGLIAGLLFALIGFQTPNLLLSSRIARRQKEIRKAMPDALDLLTICVEAGLGFDAAIQKVFEKWDNELARAFGRVIREIQLGKLRREALRDMANRLGVEEMTSFVAAVIQSEQLGVSMAHVLRIQSDQMRVRRRQQAEEEAHKAPIKMLIPMALLIFPSICIVLMTPAILIFLRSGFMGL